MLGQTVIDGRVVCSTCVELATQKTRKIADRVVVTTTHSIDGYRVRKYLGVESVEFVIGTGVFSEITTNIQDLVGMRSSAFEGKLQAAKRQAFDALKLIAVERGANAVLGIDLDYIEFSGNRIGLVLNGTLVEIVPVHQSPQDAFVADD